MKYIIQSALAIGLMGCHSVPSTVSPEPVKEFVKLNLSEPAYVDLSQYAHLNIVSNNGNICVSQEDYIKELGIIDQLIARVIILKQQVKAYKDYYEAEKVDPVKN